MNKTMVVRVILSVASLVGACEAMQCAEGSDAQPKAPKADPVDAILEKLHKTTSELTSYESPILYRYSQPLLESERVSKGVLYYSRSGGTSALRINFTTLKQDDEVERKYIEQYLVLDGARLTHPGRQFRGIWLVHLDYEIEQAKYYQLAEPNDPNDSTDVFDLVGRELPMLGFSRVKDLKKEFEITLVEQKKTPLEDFAQVHLEVKPNSVYKDNFVSIDFRIDTKLGLPAKILAVRTEPEPPFGDIEEITLLKPKVNAGIDGSVFEFKIPRSFGEPEITSLQNKNRRQ